MKQMKKIIKQNALWLWFLLCVDLFAVLLLWLSSTDSFYTLAGILVLFSLILLAAILFWAALQTDRKETYFQSFLQNPDLINEERLIKAVSEQEGTQLQYLATILRERQMQTDQLTEDLCDYEEYVEGWAHEIKTPLSLLTMILDNRSDELSPDLQSKLDYICSQLQEDVSQMLYYARLKSSTKDYLFETVYLNDLLDEVLENYAPLLEEKGFLIQNQVGKQTVYTDRRGLTFILGQIISNSIKYAKEKPFLTITTKQTEHEKVLLITDNGIGIKSYDLPYVFQKGFTGDSTDSRKKATGIGLYLAKEMAEDLKLTLTAESEWGHGVTILIGFPQIH